MYVYPLCLLDTVPHLWMGNRLSSLRAHGITIDREGMLQTATRKRTGVDTDKPCITLYVDLGCVVGQSAHYQVLTPEMPGIRKDFFVEGSVR